MLGTLPPEGKVFAKLPPPALVFGVEFISGFLALAILFVRLARVRPGVVFANALIFHIAMQAADISPLLFEPRCILAYQAEIPFSTPVTLRSISSGGLLQSEALRDATRLWP